MPSAVFGQVVDESDEFYVRPVREADESVLSFVVEVSATRGDVEVLREEGGEREELGIREEDDDVV